jgi:S-adenosyl methyltransferase
MRAADNTHDVAQRVAPESRIVCMDYDPVVLTHPRVLQHEGRPDVTESGWGNHRMDM